MLSWSAPPLPSLPGAGAVPLLHDTAGGVLRPSARGPRAGLYACGITPYDATHLGHAATYLAFDLLVRTWIDAGLEVSYTQNVTDVDDPLLERAQDTGVDWQDLAAGQIDLYRRDMTALALVPPDHFVGAVESVDLVARAVRHMLRAGAAYRLPPGPDSPGGAVDVYADLSADPDFGTLTHLGRERMLAIFAERGGDPARPGKRDALDPLLWRAERPGEPAWDAAELGRGRPGWHIECAVIAADTLQVPWDVLGGGEDLTFPHHEMSDAHLRVLHGAQATPHLHVHTGAVGLDGRKMSKSLGNLVFVSALLADGVEASALRLALLAHHYRSEWEWTPGDLERAERRLASWRRAVAREAGPDGPAALGRVRAALAGDLDAPGALAVLDEWAASPGQDPKAPALLADTAQALLGVDLRTPPRP